MRLLFCLSHSIAVLFLLRDVASHFKSILYNIPTEPNLWLNANNVAQLTKLKKKKDTGKYTIGNCQRPVFFPWRISTYAHHL